MKSNKNLNQKPKPAKGRKPKAKAQTTSAIQVRSAKPKPHGVHKIAEKVCAITDPFCPAARGSKLPDDSQLMSLAFQFRGRQTVSTDATGSGAYMFVSGFTRNAAQPTIVGTTATFTTLSASPIPTQTPGLFRIVSWGVRVKNLVAPLTSSGMVRIRLFSGLNGADMVSIDLATYNCDSSIDVPLQDCKNTIIIPRRFNPEVSTDFLPPASVTPSNNVSSFVSNGWSAVTVAVFGGPASVGILDCEFVYNYEMTFPDSDALAMAATDRPKPEPGVIKLSNELSSLGNGIMNLAITAGADFLMKSAEKVVTEAMASIMTPEALLLTL